MRHGEAEDYLPPKEPFLKRYNIRIAEVLFGAVLAAGIYTGIQAHDNGKAINIASERREQQLNNILDTLDDIHNQCDVLPKKR